MPASFNLVKALVELGLFIRVELEFLRLVAEIHLARAQNRGRPSDPPTRVELEITQIPGLRWVVF